MKNINCLLKKKFKKMCNFFDFLYLIYMEPQKTPENFMQTVRKNNLKKWVRF